MRVLRIAIIMVSHAMIAMIVCLAGANTLEAKMSNIINDKIHFGLEAETAKLRAEIAQLQADNRSLVEQMNQMVLKPNQEVIEWHEYPEEKPTETDCRNATIIPSCVRVVIKYKKSECEKPRIGVDTYIVIAYFKIKENKCQ